MAKRKTKPTPPHEPQPRLIQISVPADLYTRIEKQARLEFLSVAGYVRMLLNRHVPGG